MTRKRYIRLILACGGVQRNEAMRMAWTVQRIGLSYQTAVDCSLYSPDVLTWFLKFRAYTNTEVAVYVYAGMTGSAVSLAKLFTTYIAPGARGPQCQEREVHGYAAKEADGP